MTMDDEVREKYVEAGRVASEALTLGADRIAEGVLLLDVAEAVEAFIRDEGADPAFPCNLSLNQDAAHFSPGPGDETTFERGDLVKIDVGAQVDGYIGDNALTVEVGTTQHKALREASLEALNAAVGVVRAGTVVREIGAAIESTIRGFGFQPIVNLSGHSVEQYVQHAGLRIPNVAQGDEVLEAGQAIAIEPFATNGQGRVRDGDGGNIYHLRSPRPQRNKHAKAALSYIEEHHADLPFAGRWVAEAVDPRKVPFAMRLLERTGALKQYAILREAGDGLVSQHERTVLVEEDGCTVTTTW